MRNRRSQEYSPKEFEAVVALLQRDRQVRQNIETITGQKLAGKSAREIFDLFVAVQKAAEVKVAIAAYGRSSVVLDEARRDVEGHEHVRDELAAAREEIKNLRDANASLKRGLDMKARQLENTIAAPAMAVYAEGTPQ